MPPRGGRVARRGRTRADARTEGVSTAGVQKLQPQRKRPIEPRLAAILDPIVKTSTPTNQPAAVAASSRITEDLSGVAVPTSNESAADLTKSPKIMRVFPQSGFACSQDSLYFLCLAPAPIASTSDTEVITLNLMDHFLMPANFIPELWHGHLHAACFMLASLITKQENDIANVCTAVSMQAAGLLMQGYDDFEVYPDVVKQSLKAMLAKPAVLEYLVGGYAESLGKVAAGLMGSEVDVQTDGNNTEAALPRDTAGVATLDKGQAKELDEDDPIDFEVYDELEGAQ